MITIPEPLDLLFMAVTQHGVVGTAQLVDEEFGHFTFRGHRNAGARGARKRQLSLDFYAGEMDDEQIRMYYDSIVSRLIADPSESSWKANKMQVRNDLHVHGTPYCLIIFEEKPVKGRENNE